MLMYLAPTEFTCYCRKRSLENLFVAWLRRRRRKGNQITKPKCQQFLLQARNLAVMPKSRSVLNIFQVASRSEPSQGAEDVILIYAFSVKHTKRFVNILLSTYILILKSSLHATCRPCKKDKKNSLCCCLKEEKKRNLQDQTGVKGSQDRRFTFYFVHFHVIHSNEIGVKYFSPVESFVVAAKVEGIFFFSTLAQKGRIFVCRALNTTCLISFNIKSQTEFSVISIRFVL